jgi:Tfp pilus assembly protein PilW
VIRDEQGFTMTELLVGMASFIVVMGAILMMTVVATRNQERITDRVAANQIARPAMTYIVDALHSACTAPRAVPVQANSGNTFIAFDSKSGSEVAPAPSRVTVTLSGTTLTMVTDPVVGPTITRVLARQVTAPGGIVFRYYDYVNGQLNATPLATPLTQDRANRTARVTINFTVAPEGTGPGGSGGASSAYEQTRSRITLSDAVDLRLESAAQLTTQENAPCT